MQGLKEFREMKADSLLGWISETPDDIGKIEPTPRQRMANARRHIDRGISANVWFQRNPAAHFLYVPAGSAEEKELLSRENPQSAQE